MAFTTVDIVSSSKAVLMTSFANRAGIDDDADLWPSYKRSDMVAEPGSDFSTDEADTQNLAKIIAVTDRLLKSSELREAVQTIMTSNVMKQTIEQQTNEALMAKVLAGGRDGPRMFNEKRAEKLASKEFTGKNDKHGFRTYSDGIKNWAQALFKGGLKHLEQVEKDLLID